MQREVFTKNNQEAHLEYARYTRLVSTGKGQRISTCSILRLVDSNGNPVESDEIYFASNLSFAQLATQLSQLGWTNPNTPAEGKHEQHEQKSEESSIA